MFWAFGTLSTNSYVVYIKLNVAEGVDKKQLLSHYEFRKDIVLLNWIDPTYKPQIHQVKDAPNKETTGLMLLFSSPSSVLTMTTASSKANLCTDTWCT